MENPRPEQVQAALAPLQSLLDKSAKAQQKLRPGSGHHTRLGQHLAALRYALARLQPDSPQPQPLAGKERASALEALKAMNAITVANLAKFSPGSAQHSLLRNRLQALQLAEAVLRAEGQPGES